MRLPILPDLLVPLDPARPEPIHRQLYRGIREAILAGGLPAGVRIPSTRRLAEQLGISRSTVLVAFDQLVAEGYLVGAVGSGSYVARDIPQHLRRSPAPGNGDARLKAPRVAARVARVAQSAARALPAVPYPNAFWSGVPPIDVFPIAAWNRIVARRLRGVKPADLHHGPAAGYRPLREAIAAYLTAARGMRCSADQVIVLASAQEALELAAHVLLDPGDAAWMEEPGWSGARGAFVSADVRIVPVPVDADGLDVAAGLVAAPDARAVYLSPSHQYPLGATLGLERRMALLDWAARSGAWLIEDDYDSEFRYSGRPLTALHGLDSRGSVIYVGTFNKTMFPALRVGYLVVPEALVESFLTLRRLGGQHAPTGVQGALTDFIVEGHYARHLRRSRAVCRERRDALLDAVRRHADGLIEIGEADTGLHTVGWLPAGADDRAVSDAAARLGVHAAPLSAHYAGTPSRPGLVLGYASLPPEVIDRAMQRLASATNGVVRGARNGSGGGPTAAPP